MKMILCLVLVGFIIQSNCFFIQSSNNLTYTIFNIYFPQDKINNSKLYLRGDNCNLTWSKGALLNQTSNNHWQTVLMCTQNVTISMKVLLNNTVWMFGNNFIFQGGQKIIDIYPSFSPVANKIVDKSGITSKILNNTRKCSIYFPPSYYDNTLKSY